MCGIFAYTGSKKAIPILVDGLTSLEYRGYDSAGIFTPADGVFKAVGPVVELRKLLPENANGTSGIAHTRWATHGAPTAENAHPHADQNEILYLVHNGIVENYKELKEELLKAGHTFKSQTDTEVLAHLLGVERGTASSMDEALESTLQKVRGTYGLAVIEKAAPSTIYAAAMGSPIAIGVGENEMCIGSDATAILRVTKQIIYLEDGEFAKITPQNYEIKTLDRKITTRAPEEIEWDADTIKKNGFDHYMLKEIMEAPEVLENSARGRLLLTEGRANLGGLAEHEKELQNIKRLVIVACGSAYYAGVYGKYLIEEYAGIPVEVAIGSEFRYRAHIPEEGAALLAISQSGETADTLASIKEAKRRGILTLGIVNVVGSTIARETDLGVYNHAGPEVGVASTKAFLSQMEVLALLALYLGRQRHLSVERAIELGKAIAELPTQAAEILSKHEEVKVIAEKYKDVRDMLYIGRKYNFAGAYEGALKLKEVSYIHAEGYGAGEMKHGPIAMIDPLFPTLAIVPDDAVFEKTISNIEEIKARKGPVIAIATTGNTQIKELADDVLWIPKAIEPMAAILAIIPMQLLAYYVGVAKGYNVDRPRNLAKSVTVE